MPKVVVCIPAFNEAKNIADIVQRAKSYAATVIVCDDGSLDDTAENAQAAGARVVRHVTNKGYGAAIKTLFMAAKEEGADVMVTIDSDGQHNPDQIPSLVNPLLSQGYDIVIGSRFLEKSDEEKVPPYRSFGIKTITKFTQAVSYKNITDAQSGFRAYGRHALAKIELANTGMAVSTEILFRAKENSLTIAEVPVTITYDVDDASTHNPVSHGLGVIAAIIRFASLKHPLVFYGIPGLAFLLFGSLFMVIVYPQDSVTKLVLSLGAIIIGVILVVSSVILYVISLTARSKRLQRI
jgi:glycosyltransferase involved in cell wall biosynthesis